MTILDVSMPFEGQVYLLKLIVDEKSLRFEHETLSRPILDRLLKEFCHQMRTDNGYTKARAREIERQSNVNVLRQVMTLSEK